MNNADRYPDSHNRIGKEPVDQLAGDEIFVGHDQLVAVPLSDGGGADPGNGAAAGVNYQAFP